MVTEDLKIFFDRNGYAIARQLFDATETARYREHYMQLRASGSYPGDLIADTLKPNDPLQRFPRMLQMHRWDEMTLRWMLDERLNRCLTALLGQEPYAVQSMLYFKPPGARGQALHQDNFYLQVKPGTCMAAWLALDPCDEANGCMKVVPGSHKWPILCPVEADTESSFTNVAVPLPEGVEAVSLPMEAGDVLFFNGSLVHGSSPNCTADRFRRSLIAHYVEGSTQELTKYDLPVLRMDGSELNLSPSPGGGPCSGWTSFDGHPTTTVMGVLPAPQIEA